MNLNKIASTCERFSIGDLCANSIGPCGLKRIVLKKLIDRYDRINFVMKNFNLVKKKRFFLSKKWASSGIFSNSPHISLEETLTKKSGKNTCNPEHKWLTTMYTLPCRNVSANYYTQHAELDECKIRAAIVYFYRIFFRRDRYFRRNFSYRKKSGIVFWCLFPVRKFSSLPFI